MAAVQRLQRLAPRLARFRRDERGGVAVLMAVGLVMLLGAAAIAIDLSYAYVERNRLQVAADTAALAAANALPDETAARAAALDYAGRNMPTDAHGDVLVESDVDIGNWDDSTRSFTIGATPTNAVRVSTRRDAANGNPLGLFFGRALGIASLDLSASAVAGGTRRPLCLLALDPLAEGALAMGGSAGVVANGCDVQVNSESEEALTAEGSAALEADRICVHGGYDQEGSSGITPAPATGCPAVADPLEWLQAPADGLCDHSGASFSDHSGGLGPGVYCGGLSIDGASNVTLSPGIYVIKGGNLRISDSSVVTGDYVGFYLTDGALIDFGGAASISLKAPSDGEMAGVLIFQDRNENGTHVFDSSAITRLEGTVYLPGGVLRGQGSSPIGGASAFSIYIARRFELGAGGGFDINSDYEASDVPLPARLDTVGSALLD